MLKFLHGYYMKLSSILLLGVIIGAPTYAQELSANHLQSCLGNLANSARFAPVKQTF